MINLMGVTIVDIDIEFKMKISRIRYFESKLLEIYFKEIGSNK